MVSRAVSSVRLGVVAVRDAVLHVVGAGAVGEVLGSVVGGVTVPVPGFHAGGYRPVERGCDKPVNGPGASEGEVASAWVGRWFADSAGESADHSGGCGDRAG